MGVWIQPPGTDTQPELQPEYTYTKKLSGDIRNSELVTESSHDHMKQHYHKVYLIKK